ncbi:MAG: Flp pilus assembly complex ATPase component TadA [Candidatus Omnitrophica bacterium]|nr:Flp pilus assembly complex ATPase component TadA [Candidatus Omnitrophota bacterium]
MLGLGRKKKSKDATDDLQKKNTGDSDAAIISTMDESSAEGDAGAGAAEAVAEISQEESAALVGDSKGAPMMPDEAGQAVRDAMLEQVTEASEETTSYTSEEDLLAVLAEQVGMELVKINDYEIEQSIVDLVPPDLARQYKVFPLEIDEETDTITLAISDPLNVQTLDDLRIWLDHNVRGVIASEEEIDSVIEEFYGSGGESVDDVLHELDSQDYNIDFKDNSFGNLEKIVHEAPIVKLVNLILLQAIKDRASDLHVEPFENTLRIRYRVDGILHETVPPPSHLTDAIISRLKVMSGLNIAERRLPQDGRVKLSMSDRNVELRVSSLPTVNGESVVMRILDSQMMDMGLENIGMLPDALEMFDKVIKRPNGIVLVTGPTGCGKTTTLYAALRRVFSPMLKMITTENPVEYQMDGVVQVNINHSVGLTFARCLRAILRQDPDIIMVGEIRDFETAQMAIESSLTGHLVLSTLHTNDAPSTLTRLIDMDVEPFLITSAVTAVVAQRLIRKVCLDCKEPYKPDPALIREIGFDPAEVGNINFFHGRGCAECNYTGYKGRIGIFELLLLSDEVKEQVLNRDSSAVIFRQARKDGMRTMREDGWEKVLQGLTTVEEVLSSTSH